PRFEWHRDDLVTFDVSGLGRLLGDASSIGEEVRRSAEARGLRVQVAVAATWTAAMVLAYARPGLTVVGGGAEASALGSVPIGILDKVAEHVSPVAESQLPIFRAWGLKTLGDLAALPPRGLAARVGRRGFLWQ